MVLLNPWFAEPSSLPGAERRVNEWLLDSTVWNSLMTGDFMKNG